MPPVLFKGSKHSATNGDLPSITFVNASRNFVASCEY